MARVFLGLAAVSLLLAGCGGGGSSSASKPLTKAQYQTQLQGLSDQASADLQKALGPSAKIKQGDLSKVQAELSSFADRLGALNPPADVKDLHTQLIAALKDLGAALPGMIKALNAAKDPSTAIAALFGNPALQKLSRLQQEYKAKGYNISGLLGSTP